MTEELDKKDQQILVTGATGYIGGRLINELLERGYKVRAMARDSRKLRKRGEAWSGVEIAEADVFDMRSLIKALQGVHTAYYLIHSIDGGSDFASRDTEAARNFAWACEVSRVKRIIYLGGLGAEGDDLSPHLRSRHETGGALRTGSVPVTELRAAVIIGSGSASFEIMRDLAAKLPVMITPRWVQSKCEPIGVKDAISFLSGVLEEPRSIGETLEIGCGDVLTYGEMLKRLARQLGKRLIIIPVPVLTPRLSSYWLNIVTTVPMSIGRALIEGLRNDVVCEDRRLEKWLGFTPLGYDEAIARTLARDQKGGDLESRWTDAGPIPDDPALLAHRFHYVDQRERTTDIAPQQVFRVVNRIGGKNGYFTSNWLWNIRGFFDRMVGGVGMRRGRPRGRSLAPGDPVDFWRVEDYIPNRRLLLKAEMKLPGIGKLDFEVFPAGSDGRTKTTLRQTAKFWPTGILGKIYWFSVFPFHGYIFNQMIQNIIKRAEQEPSGDGILALKRTDATYGN